MINPKLLEYAKVLQEALTPLYNELADIQEQANTDLSAFATDGSGRVPDSPEAIKATELYQMLDTAVVALAEAYMAISDTVQEDTPGTRELATNDLETNEWD